jgi:hypothetical protein
MADTTLPTWHRPLDTGDVMRGVLLVIVSLGVSCGVGGALFVPQTVTPETLCEHLATTTCPQGDDDNCPDLFRRARISTSGCEAQENDSLRCLWVDLPDNADAELDAEGTCVSDACDDESAALCACETGAPCS